jgi:DNA-binding GntR family transcriptional regulator
MPIPQDGSPPTRGLLRDEVYARLCDAIVAGTFAPGEQLRDSEIAHWLGVSRTPVREALLRLARTGLVISTPGKSTVVAGLEPQTVRDAQEVVAALHELAVRTATPFIRPSDLETMRRANLRFEAALAAGDAEEAIRADDELHGVPVAVTANLAIGAVLDQFMPVLRRAERLRFGSLSGRRSVRWHDGLIKALEAGDADAAAEASTAAWSTLARIIDLAPSTDQPAAVPTR